MKTLTLLAAILLLVLQAQAEPLRQTADEVPAQDKTGVEDLDVEVSFAGYESLVQEASGVRSICYCRIRFCIGLERRFGRCYLNGRVYLFCCR
ncbi:defensin-5-like [Trichechus manatus latirostris]|uniref:Defensin-5-like n=1 Tax=Trichechus manatus latirostris TaxID=127582 RepID=A0A2Y9R9Y9_TRIMA|nr:defensin-5-like [Trichechus manatus latirostris]